MFHLKVNSTVFSRIYVKTFSLRKTNTPQVKQLVPTHYYGPPSAGWGGFQPGHTGGGWGAPYWYK